MAENLRVLIVSDTHGTLDDRIVEQAARSDLVVHAGDIGSREVMDALTPREGKLVAVRGNNDVTAKWHEEEWPLLETIPWEARLDLPGGELVVVHGHGYGYPGRNHARMRRDYPDARAVVYGHSHLRCVDKSESPWVLNPGAAGSVRTFGGPSYCLLLAGSKGWRLNAHQYTAPDAGPAPPGAN